MQRHEEQLVTKAENCLPRLADKIPVVVFVYVLIRRRRLI